MFKSEAFQSLQKNLLARIGLSPEAKLRRAAIWDLDLAEAKKLLQEYKFDRYDLETTAKRIDDGWKFREAKGENLVLDRTDTKRREIVGVLHEYIRSYK